MKSQAANGNNLQFQVPTTVQFVQKSNDVIIIDIAGV